MNSRSRVAFGGYSVSRARRARPKAQDPLEEVRADRRRRSRRRPPPAGWATAPGVRPAHRPPRRRPSASSSAGSRSVGAPAGAASAAAVPTVIIVPSTGRCSAARAVRTASCRAAADLGTGPIAGRSPIARAKPRNICERMTPELPRAPSRLPAAAAAATSPMPSRALADHLGQCRPGRSGTCLNPCRRRGPGKTFRSLRRRGTSSKSTSRQRKTSRRPYRRARSDSTGRSLKRRPGRILVGRRPGREPFADRAASCYPSGVVRPLRASFLSP